MIVPQSLMKRGKFVNHPFAENFSEARVSSSAVLVVEAEFKTSRRLTMLQLEGLTIIGSIGGRS